MHGATKIEASWRVLFDIALACGDSVQTLHLTHPGFLHFLYAAELLGVKTGVYLVLVEKLWAHHAVTSSPSASQIDMFDDSITCLDKPRTNKRRPSYDVKKNEILKLGVCGFEGFCDMMNVICVRCFQSRKCVDLYTKDQETLAQAILLSAEDVVTLPESVKYAAQKYLKHFIARNVVRRNTKLFLNPMLNDWTKFTNVVITHIVGSLLDTVVLPIFRRYSKRGLMYERHFHRLIDELFHTFSPPQKAAARAIFTYSDFFDVRELLKSSRVTSTINDVADAQSLSCESFVEALLMLGVVEFADENQFPHHRSLTAKTWFVFENVYCRAAGRQAMAEEIVYTNQPQSIRPIISFAYPHYVPVEQVTSFLIGGLNVTPYHSIKVENVDGHPLAALVGGRLIQPLQEVKEESVKEVSSKPEDSLLFSDANISPMLAPSPMSADIEAKRTSNTESPTAPDTKAVEETPFPQVDNIHNLEESQSDTFSSKAVANTAVKLGNAEFETKDYSKFNSPVYGIRASCVYLNQECVHTIDHGRNYVEVLIPPSFNQIQIFRMSVRLEENVLVAGKGMEEETYITRYVFLPVQRVTVSLRDEDGKTVYSAMDVLLHTSAVFQVIPAPLLAVLRGAFDDGVEKDVMSGEDRLPRFKLPQTCKNLGLINSSAAVVACQAATQNYFNVCRECDKSSLGVDKECFPLEEVSIPISLNFHEFMCIIAQLCIRQAGTTTDVPNVVNFVSASLAKREETLPSDGEASTEKGSHDRDSSMSPRSTIEGNLPTIPYNAHIEVPYENAIKKKCRNMTESSDAAESFLANIRTVGAEIMKLSGIVSELPPFPMDVMTESAVSQYEGDEVEGLASDIHEVSMKVQEEFMLDEIIIQSDAR